MQGVVLTSSNDSACLMNFQEYEEMDIFSVVLPDRHTRCGTEFRSDCSGLVILIPCEANVCTGLL